MYLLYVQDGDLLVTTHKDSINKLLFLLKRKQLKSFRKYLNPNQEMNGQKGAVLKRSLRSINY